jgi:hypothetical protein
MGRCGRRLGRDKGSYLVLRPRLKDLASSLALAGWDGFASTNVRAESMTVRLFLKGKQVRSLGACLGVLLQSVLMLFKCRIRRM